MPVAVPEQGGVSGSHPRLPPRSLLGPVHQTRGGRARPLLEGLVEAAHGVHALQREGGQVLGERRIQRLTSIVLLFSANEFSAG